MELILFNCNKFYGLFAEKIVRSDSLVMGLVYFVNRISLFCKPKVPNCADLRL